MTQLPPQIIELERLRRRCERRQEALARCDAYYERSRSSAEYERARGEILEGVDAAEASLREKVGALHRDRPEVLGRWVEVHRELLAMGRSGWGAGSLEAHYADVYEAHWRTVDEEGEVPYDLVYGVGLVEKLPARAQARYREFFGKL